MKPRLVLIKNDTSLAALDSQTTEHITETQNHILAILRVHGPMCDQSLHQVYQRVFGSISDSGLRTRRSELVAQGKVEDSGARARLPSGRLSIEWRAV